MANVAMILADPDASPKEKYDALLSAGWEPSAASSASHYTPEVPKPAVSPLATEDRRREAEARVAAMTAPAPGAAVSPRLAAPAATPAPAAPAAATPAPAGPKLEGTSASRHYTAIGEAVEEDYRDFAKYLRGLADEGKLTKADGTALPMYSSERIAKLTLPELKALVESNPRYANMFFKKPTEEVAAGLEGTGRTGIGPRSGMVSVPEIPAAAPAAPKPAEAAASIVETTSPPGTPPEELEKKAEVVAEVAKDPSFAEKLDKVSRSFGVSILEVLQAGLAGYIGGATGNWQKTAYQMRKEKEEREKSLLEAKEEARIAREAEVAARREEIAAQDRRLALQLEASSTQAELARKAEALALDKSLSMQEKIARLQAAQRAAGVPVSADAAAADMLK